MITQLKTAINLLGRHTDNDAKHRYASRKCANDIRSLDLLNCKNNGTRTTFSDHLSVSLQNVEHFYH